MANPCDLPCPKCGADDVARTFIGYGTTVLASEYGRAPHKWLSGSTYAFKAERDMIRHTCRICGYVWVTPPRAKPRALKETSGLST